MNMTYINVPEIHHVQQSRPKQYVERNYQNSDKSFSATEKLERSLKTRKRKTGYVTKRIDMQGDIQEHIYLNHHVMRYIKLHN